MGSNTKKILIMVGNLLPLWHWRSCKADFSLQSHPLHLLQLVMECLLHLEICCIPLSCRTYPPLCPIEVETVSEAWLYLFLERPSFLKYYVLCSSYCFSFIWTYMWKGNYQDGTDQSDIISFFQTTYKSQFHISNAAGAKYE